MLVEYGTRLGVNPLQLWVVIQVGNTAAVLTEHVIPRNHTAQRQTLGDEVQLLLQYEVSVDAGGGNGLYTTDRRSLCRVRHIGRIGEVAPRAITVLWQEGIRRDVVDTSPHLRHLPAEAAAAVPLVTTLPRVGLLTVRTGDVYLEDSALGNLEVQV